MTRVTWSVSRETFLTGAHKIPTAGSRRSRKVSTRRPLRDAKDTKAFVRFTFFVLFVSTVF
jgi:hypothetical protein